MSSQRVAYSLLASAGVASAGATSFYFGPQLSDVYFAERLLAKEQSLLSRLETGLETRAKTLRETERENPNPKVARARESLLASEKELDEAKEALAKWQRKEKDAKENRQKQVSEYARLEKERAEWQEKRKSQKEDVLKMKAKTVEQREKVNSLRKNAEKCMERLVGKKKKEAKA
jgi:uncharacterized membrane protein YgaE (UPF0421/DUF939 family)